MKPVLASIFISVAVQFYAAKASAFEPDQMIHVELAGGRTVAGKLVQQTEDVITISYRGVATAVVESVPRSAVKRIMAMDPRNRRADLSLPNELARPRAVNLAQLAERLLFGAAQP